MSDLFGLSMNYIMIALVILLAVALSTVGWVLLRNRVLFWIGVRNIPRRRAQTILIVIGLMLSTLIISTAFSIGDTVDYSITNQAYERLHSIDETVQASAGESDNPFGSSSLVSARPMAAADASQWVQQIKSIGGVDGAVRVIRAPVPVKDQASGLTEPVVVLVGVDATSMQGFESDIQSKDGKQLSLTDLGANEIYANESAADKLKISVGNTLQLFTSGEPHEFVVRDIVKDRVLTGAVAGVSRGLVLNLSQAQALFSRPDEVDLIAVSNSGGVHNDLSAGTQIKAAINNTLPKPFLAASTKQDVVDAANQAASFLTTFFVILGLFAIASGMMLIFLIFVMLAAERRVEMGMVRAVGTKRRHLVQMFLSEGMGYNVLAAAVGCGLGVVVSIGMVRIMAALFADFGLSIVFHVSARSLIVSYSLGVVLTFLTVVFSSWRISNLNITAAIRDMAETTPRQERPRVSGVGSLIRYAFWLLFKPTSMRSWITSILVCIGGVALAAFSAVFYIAGVAIYGSSAASGVAAVLLFIAGVLVSATALVIAFTGFLRIFQLGGLAILLGVPLLVLGFASGQAFPAGAGLSLEIAGIALLGIQVGVPNRLAATAAGVVLLVAWLLLAGGQLFPSLDGGPEMFFLSGVTMILASTFVLVYNADLMLVVLTRAGSVFSTLIPSIRTAVAYPLANKFRTGMTIAMISLVMFALVMTSTMNSNFNRIFLGDDALGGYQVAISENPNNHIGDVAAALQSTGTDGAALADGIAVQDEVRHANQNTAEVRNVLLADTDPKSDAAKFSKYDIRGPSAGFIGDNGIKFQSRAEGLDSDAAVWARLASDPKTAVIDGNAVGGGGFGGGEFSLDGVKQGDPTFKPVTVQVRDATAPGTQTDVQIIGIITPKASAIYSGLFLSPATFSSIFPKPESSDYLLKLKPGVNAGTAADSIEKTLSSQGVQADSLRKLIDGFQAQNQGFSYLIQGFMGIGLFVGIAAVGVIAFRTVVERRQQIGMLRAIGYTRNAIAISFMMESSFIAALGVLSGIGLALLLAYQLLSSDEFARSGIQGFYVPWLQIIGIGGFAFIASLLMTIIPSRQASSIPIAEALRYE